VGGGTETLVGVVGLTSLLPHAIPATVITTMTNSLMRPLMSGLFLLAHASPRAGIPVAYRQPTRSVLSFALASATVCHCMFDGVSGPPQARGLKWSMT
jgi:hypothetical protein